MARSTTPATPSSPASGTPPGPSVRSRRYAFACASCKARKIRCSGEQPTCKSCRRTGNECTWPESRANATANARIRQLEDALRQATSMPDRSSATPIPQPVEDLTVTAASGTTVADVGTEPNTSRTPGQLNNAPSLPSPSDTVADPEPAASLWSQVGVGEDGTVIYNGPTSRFHAGSLEASVPFGEGTLDATGHDGGVSAGAGSVPSSDSRSRLTTHIETLQEQYELVDTVWTPLLTAKPIMVEMGLDMNAGMALLDIYWTWLHPLHSCVYRPCFIMDMVLNGPYYSDFLLMAIFSLASRHLREQDTRFAGVGRGEQFLARAKLLLMDEMAATKPRIPTIQGLLILGGRQCAMGCSSEGWLYTGMAIRMLFDIGLHLNTSQLAELERLTPADVEARKRLYNSAYIWDKTISLALGRPPSLTLSPTAARTILDHCDDLREWKPIHVPELPTSYTPVPSYSSTTFCAFIQLHEITTKMMLLFSQTLVAAQLERQVGVLEHEFCQWYAQLPAALRIDDTASLTQSPPPHIVSLNLIYHTLHILLYRPQLNALQTSRQSHGVMHCISHSKTIHMIMALYRSSFPYRLMTYQVSYCTYTAATIDAYEMRVSPPHSSARAQAATRLSTAVRILQDEARQTPGSGRSLDIIRRQLSAASVSIGSIEDPGRAGVEDESHSSHVVLEEPCHPGCERLHQTHSSDHIYDTSHVQPVAVLQRTAARFDSSHSNQRQPGANAAARTGEIIPNDIIDLNGLSWLGPGDLDTGFGFHPDAFPWGNMNV